MSSVWLCCKSIPDNFNKVLSGHRSAETAIAAAEQNFRDTPTYPEREGVLTWTTENGRHRACITERHGLWYTVYPVDVQD